MQMTVCTRNLTKEFITKVNSLFKPKKGCLMFAPVMNSGCRLADDTPAIGSPGADPNVAILWLIDTLTTFCEITTAVWEK